MPGGGKCVSEFSDRQLCELHQRLRDKRIERKLTQKYVESKTGIRQSMLSAFESGSREMTLSNILALCELYECSLSYLLGETETECPEKPAAAGLTEALALEQLLTEPLSELERGLCDDYIRLTLYRLIRTLYLSNPRHARSKLFTASGQDADSALDRAADNISSLNAVIKPSAAKGIELPFEYSAALREFITSTEMLINDTEHL